MTILEAVIMAIVEGLTEFLPVSSTGHMVITSSFLGVADDDFTKVFEVAVQLGAILAVVLLYWKKFIQFNNWQFYGKLLVAVVPALLMGFLFGDVIEKLLASQITVALSLLIGGIILLFVDKWFHQPVSNATDLLATEVTSAELIESDAKLTFGKAFFIGIWQVMALVPGVSRSAASIVGGMQQKLTRNFAAEFSFLLAVPTMLAATGYSLFLKKWHHDNLARRGYEIILENRQHLMAFVAGNIVAFAVALLAIRFFITYLKAYGFRVFGYYRIVLGLVLLLLIFAGKL